MAKVYINESGKDQTYELFDDSAEVSFGRGAANDVQIADAHSSKHHMVVRRLRGRWRLIDLESKNGTRVNGAFRNAHWLAHGDTVTVGAVVLRFDAEGQPSGAPTPRAAPSQPAARPAAAGAARPAAAAPAARPAAVAAPAGPPPLVALRTPPAAASAAPAPRAAAPRASAPTTARSAPRSRRETEEDDYEEDERPRVKVRPRGMSGAVIITLGVLGIAVVVLILNSAMTGENPNSLVRAKATKLIQKMEYKEALDVLQREGVPDTPGWYAIVAEIETVKGLIAEKAKDARETEAFASYNKEIARVIAVGRLRPEGHPGDAEAATLLRRWFNTYGDTMLARTILNAKASENAQYAGYQQIMRENPEPGRDEVKAIAELEAGLAPLLTQQKLGAAYQRAQLALQLERLSLSAEALGRFEPKVDNQLTMIKQNAMQLLDGALTEGGGWAKRGETSVGKAKVKAILKMLDWPEPDLQRHADDAMRAW